jgi:UDP:flavonoid glycosyltransferase YjiC (YdhE family)
VLRIGYLYRLLWHYVLFWQGFGLQLSPSQLSTPAFREAIIEVLTNPKYTRVAQSLAVKIKARKRTPVQEAAGKDLPSCLDPGP